MDLKETRLKYGLSRPELARLFQQNGYNVPIRSIESWESASVSARKCPDYVDKLLSGKLEELMQKKESKP